MLQLQHQMKLEKNKKCYKYFFNLKNQTLQTGMSKEFGRIQLPKP